MSAEAPLSTPKKSSQYNLLIDALSLARTSLAEQSRLLGDTQDRVQQLVSAQQRLQELAAVEVKKRRAVAARCHELEALNVGGANGDPKLMQRVATLRKRMGAIVREQFTLQNETERLQNQLREADATNEAYLRQNAREKARLQDVREAQERVAKQIAEAVAETEAAEQMAQAREEELRAKINAMEAAEAERLAKEMAEEESVEQPPAPSIVVTRAPPPPSGPIGGFEL
eukprot:CAMPEP_0119080078 /NCGR_PEP_ID=MMETSP1178-20130426/110410_1 /TAXON_ID=33656 /ORGANISM="unid sp, Strain CCMP2000" /LENGTH=228 /DNA_ID=CAMNT_0007062643 /DNA_START=91 /DNA_END=777 /DNA_ORIENTATION=+